MSSPSRKRWPLAADYTDQSLGAAPPISLSAHHHPMQMVPAIMANFIVEGSKPAGQQNATQLRTITIQYRKTSRSDGTEAECYRSDGLRSGAAGFPEELWFSRAQLESVFEDQGMFWKRADVETLVAGGYIREGVLLAGSTDVIIYFIKMPANDDDDEEVLEPENPAEMVDGTKSNDWDLQEEGIDLHSDLSSVPEDLTLDTNTELSSLPSSVPREIKRRKPPSDLSAAEHLVAILPASRYLEDGHPGTDFNDDDSFAAYLRAKGLGN